MTALSESSFPPESTSQVENMDEFTVQPSEHGDLNATNDNESPCINKLHNLIIANEAYLAALESTQELLDLHILQKEEKESAMRAALPLTTSSVPVSTTLYHTPFFQTPEGLPAPPSTSEVEYAFVHEPEDPNGVLSIWTDGTDALLLDLVTKRKREIRIRDLDLERKRVDLELAKLRGNLAVSESSDKVVLEREISGKVELYESLTKTVRDYEKLSYEMAGLETVPLMNYDWFSIAQHSQLSRHGEAACRLRFFNKLDPILSKRFWTETETEMLKELLEKYGFQKWEIVSAEISGRSPVDCCRYFRQNLMFEKNDQKTKNKNKNLNFEKSKNENENLEKNEEKNRNENLGFEKICRKKANIPAVFLTRFSAEEVVKLVHGLIVTGGTMALASSFLRGPPGVQGGPLGVQSGRTEGQCYRFWKNNLNCAGNVTPFTKKELTLLRKFGRETKSKSLHRLAQKFPNRLFASVKEKFLEMFRNEDGRWVETGLAVDPIDAPSRQQDTVILHRLYEYVASKISTPLCEDPSLTLGDLLTDADIMSPVISFLNDLRLLPASQTTHHPDVHSALCQEFSPLDLRLFELFNPPLLGATQRGRRRKVNPFGSIQGALQATTSQEKEAVLRNALLAFDPEGPEGPGGSACLLIPPSSGTMDGLLKLKELCENVEEVEADVYAACHVADLQTIQRRVTSLFLATEVLTQRILLRDLHEGEGEEEEEGQGGGGEEVKEKKSRKKLTGRKLMGTRLKWFHERREEKAKERRLKKEREELAAKELGGLVVKKKRKRVVAPPVRQSSRLRKPASDVTQSSVADVTQSSGDVTQTLEDATVMMEE